MASPSPSKARAGSKRRTDSNNTLNRDNVADLAGPSTFMRIPAVQNHISRNADILQQAANTIRHKGSRQGGEHTRTSPIISQAFSQGTGLFGREVTLIDSESDFDRAESDSGNEAPSSPVKKEVLQLRAELAAARQREELLLKAHAGRHKELTDLKRTCEAVESRSSLLTGELEKLQTIHTKLKENFICQICLEPLEKPWTLSPCGHVACLGCLLNWFKTPRADEDCEHPDAPITRIKTCPQCRTVVLTRPTPSFILKNIVEEMQSVDLLDHSLSNSTDAEGADVDPADPWANIFPDPCHCAAAWLSVPDLGEPSELTGDVESDVLSIDSPSESAAVESDFQARREHLNHVMEWEVDMRNAHAGGWVAPRWEPPRFDFGGTQVTNEDTIRLNRPQHEIISLLRRGATKQMISFFQLTYDHDHGIVVNGEVQIQLGWNISRNSDDEIGRSFMESVMAEMSQFPERFGVTQVHQSSPRAIVRLVPSLGAPEDDNASEGSWATEDSFGDL